MKKFFLTVCVVTLVFGVAGIAHVYALGLGTEITIYDKSSDSKTWHGVDEDGEVEPGAAHGQEWDLEGFFLKDSTLSMVGGYNFKDGVGGFKSGDIFIDKDGDSAQYGSDIAGQHGYNNTVMNNVFGYDYVLDLDFDAMTYDVYEIDGDTQVKTIKYAGFRESNAWRYESGGNYIEQGMFEYNPVGYDAAAIQNLFLGGGTHNVVTGFDMSFLGVNTEFISHFAIECGNDNLMGHYDPVPEPGTLLLLGAGLIGLLALGRKRVKK